MQAADPASATRASCKYGSMVLAEPTNTGPLYRGEGPVETETETMETEEADRQRARPVHNQKDREGGGTPNQ